MINRASRLKTVPSAHAAYPVKVKGFTRGWWARTNVKGLTTTFLGCVRLEEFRKFRKPRPNDDGFNGVFFEISDRDLVDMDKREMGYERILIQHELLEFYEFQPSPEKESEFFIYVNKFPSEEKFSDSLPSPDVPIVQSYVDICMEGCLELEMEFPFQNEDEFVREFLDTCHEWNSHWVNDRIQPRRPHAYFPLAFKVDQILYDSPLEPIYDTVRIE